jgi:hypothetical protein
LINPLPQRKGKEMTTQHTPGPWNYIQRGTQVWGRSVGGCQLQESDHLIADIRGWGHIQYLPNGADVQDANGRLIAAAPDLLEALKEMLDNHEDACTGYGEGAADKARAAIAKATGES